jgi:hypothetical protein
MKIKCDDITSTTISGIMAELRAIPALRDEIEAHALPAADYIEVLASVIYHQDPSILYTLAEWSLRSPEYCKD